MTAECKIDDSPCTFRTLFRPVIKPKKSLITSSLLQVLALLGQSQTSCYRRAELN